MTVENLKIEYGKKRGAIRARLDDFKRVFDKNDKDIFAELCFCICTPQSKAIYCDKSVRYLKKTGNLYNGNALKIRKGLKAVRFPNNKSTYIVEARNFFTEKYKIKIKGALLDKDIFQTREWLVKNVKGIGYKEASHFLRNIGLGEELAILDVHILKNMKRYGAVEELPKTLTRLRYLELEKAFREFADRIKIPMAELDLLFWSNETGIIFK